MVANLNPSTPSISAGLNAGVNNPSTIRNMAQGVRQNVTNSQNAFMNAVNSKANNWGGTFPAPAPGRIGQASAELSEEYIKAGAFLANNREKVARFVDRILFG